MTGQVGAVSGRVYSLTAVIPEDRPEELAEESPGRALMEIWELFGGAWRDASGGGVRGVDPLVILWGKFSARHKR